MVKLSAPCSGCKTGPYHRILSTILRLAPHVPSVFFVLFVVSVALSQRPGPTRDNLIVPGHRIGGIELGVDRVALVRQLGFKPGVDQEWETTGDGCKNLSLIWHFPDETTATLGFSFEAEKLTRVSTRTRFYHTASGIGVGMSAPELKRHVTRCKAFAVLGDYSAVTGNVDLIYWVEDELGIAYQLAMVPRVLDEIIVFRSSAPFRPHGCLRAPQRLVELAPFATSIPAEFYTGR